MRTAPYASATSVFWVVDNGSSHAGKTSIARLESAYPNARLIVDNDRTADGNGWTVRAFSRVPTGRAVLLEVVVCS